jgi:ribosome-associated protein
VKRPAAAAAEIKARAETRDRVKRSVVPPLGAVDELITAALERSPAAADRSEAKRRETEIDERVTAQLKKCVAALIDRKAEKLVVLNLQGLTAMSDYFVFATATNERQSQALADAVERAMKEEGRRPQAIEGYQTARWILLDYGDVVFHVFHEESRRFYGLERLWGDAADATSAFAG